MIIGEERPKNVNDKILGREVILEKTPDGKESLKIIVKASMPGGQESPSQAASRPAVQDRPVRPVSPTGQTGPPQGRPRTFKPKRPEEGTWKQNVPKIQGKMVAQKPTFGQLLNKYTKAVQQDRPIKKRAWSPPRRGGSPIREGPNKHRGDAVTVFPPQRAYATMPWMPPASSATSPVWEHEGVWMQCFPMPYPLNHQGEGSRTPVHERLGPR